MLVSILTKASLAGHLLRWPALLPVEMHLDGHFRILRPGTISAVAAETIHGFLVHLPIGLPTSSASMIEVRCASSRRYFRPLPVAEGEAPDVSAPLAFRVDRVR